MPVLPKCIHVIGASIQTARLARRLKRPRSAVAAQHAALKTLLLPLSRTAAGRASGLEPNLTYTQFQSRAPLRHYDHLAPWIDRMQRGEADVLWPGRCALYARTSGTTTGRPKTLPVTDELLAHFRRAGGDALLHYTARIGHCGVFRGRHLLLGGSTALTPLAENNGFRSFLGELSGIAALNLPAWVDRHLYEPGAAIARIDDWPQRLDAIVARVRRLDITLLAGIPQWLLALADALCTAATQGSARPLHLRTFWPNLECVLHGGTPLGPFADELRRATGPDVHFHEIYAASEGFIAAQDRDTPESLRLLADAGLFFEFLPLSDYHAALPAALGAKALPLEAVRAGEDYVLLVTTPGGLCRYVLGDIVRFTSTEPPRLAYVGRTELLLNAFAEQVTEKELTASLVTVCQRHGWTITNFHVAPVVSSTLTGQNRGYHEWWVELKPLTIETPTGPLLAAELDTELIARNAGYAARRRNAVMDAPVVRLVMPGFFAHWMRHHGKFGAQHQLPRSRSDRRIAEELSAMACFNA